MVNKIINTARSRASNAQNCVGYCKDDNLRFEEKAWKNRVKRKGKNPKLTADGRQFTSPEEVSNTDAKSTMQR